MTPIGAAGAAEAQPLIVAVLLRVRVTPGGSPERLGRLADGSVRAFLAAATEPDESNARLIALLSRTLRVSSESIQIVSGTFHARKLVRIAGVSRAALSARIPRLPTGPSVPRPRRRTRRLGTRRLGTEQRARRARHRAARPEEYPPVRPEGVPGSDCGGRFRSRAHRPRCGPRRREAALRPPPSALRRAAIPRRSATRAAASE